MQMRPYLFAYVLKLSAFPETCILLSSQDLTLSHRQSLLYARIATACLHTLSLGAESKGISQ